MRAAMLSGTMDHALLTAFQHIKRESESQPRPMSPTCSESNRQNLGQEDP
jgi:hypothetical protein